MRVIAAALKMKEGSLYYHFQSKKELYEVVIREAFDQFEEGFYNVDFSAETASDYLVNLASLYVDSLSKNRQVTLIISAESNRPDEDRVINQGEFDSVNQTRRDHVAAALEASEPGVRSLQERRIISTMFLSGLYGAWVMETSFGIRPWNARAKKRYLKSYVSRLLGVS